MKRKLRFILIVAGLYSSMNIAQEQTRSHLKCYLQLENGSKIVHHFVNAGEEKKVYIESLTKKNVFMEDGVTKQKIETVYECVDMQNNFKDKQAIKVEKNTAF